MLKLGETEEWQAIMAGVTGALRGEKQNWRDLVSSRSMECKVGEEGRA